MTGCFGSQNLVTPKPQNPKRIAVTWKAYQHHTCNTIGEIRFCQKGLQSYGFLTSTFPWISWIVSTQTKFSLLFHPIFLSFACFGMFHFSNSKFLNETGTSNKTSNFPNIFFRFRFLLRSGCPWRKAVSLAPRMRPSLGCLAASPWSKHPTSKPKTKHPPLWSQLPCRVSKQRVQLLLWKSWYFYHRNMSSGLSFSCRSVQCCMFPRLRWSCPNGFQIDKSPGTGWFNPKNGLFNGESYGYLSYLTLAIPILFVGPILPQAPSNCTFWNGVYLIPPSFYIALRGLDPHLGEFQVLMGENQKVDKVDSPSFSLYHFVFTMSQFDGFNTVLFLLFASIVYITTC